MPENNTSNLNAAPEPNVSPGSTAQNMATLNVDALKQVAKHLASAGMNEQANALIDSIVSVPGFEWLSPGPADGFKNRVQLAKSYIMSGRETTREFDSCFEMNDGDAVAANLAAMAAANPFGPLAENIWRYVDKFSGTACLEKFKKMDITFPEWSAQLIERSHQVFKSQRLKSFKKEMRAELGMVEGRPSVMSQPRVLVVVSGGVAETVQDHGIDVEVFDWDNFNDDPNNTAKAPAHFSDLAAACNVPVEQSEVSTADHPIRSSAHTPGSDSLSPTFGSVDEAKALVEAGMAYLRTHSDDPVSLQYTEQIDIEISPAGQDDRVLVGREGWGSTTVNYSSEGLILDVYSGDPAILTPVSTQCFYVDDLADNEITGAWDRSTAQPDMPASGHELRDRRG